MAGDEGERYLHYEVTAVFRFNLFQAHVFGSILFVLWLGERKKMDRSLIGVMAASCAM